jgi:hypothetical protein
MQTFEQYTERLKRAIAIIRNDRPRLALAASFDFNATIQLRINETGNNSDNVPFSAYTIPYAKNRNAAGFQVAHVDFTRTGRMFANTLPRVVSSDVDKTLIRIAPSQQSEINKMRGQLRKRGNIMKPSKQEIQILTAQYSKQIIKQIKFGA